MKLAELEVLAEPFKMAVTEEIEESTGKRIWVFQKLGRTTFLRDTEKYGNRKWDKGLKDCAAKLDEIVTQKKRKKRTNG